MFYFSHLAVISSQKIIYILPFGVQAISEKSTIWNAIQN